MDTILQISHHKDCNTYICYVVDVHDDYCREPRSKHAIAPESDTTPNHMSKEISEITNMFKYLIKTEHVSQHNMSTYQMFHTAPNLHYLHFRD